MSWAWRGLRPGVKEAAGLGLVHVQCGRLFGSRCFGRRYLVFSEGVRSGSAMGANCMSARALCWSLGTVGAGSAIAAWMGSETCLPSGRHTILFGLAAKPSLLSSSRSRLNQLPGPRISSRTEEPNISVFRTTTQRSKTTTRSHAVLLSCSHPQRVGTPSTTTFDHVCFGTDAGNDAQMAMRCATHERLRKRSTLLPYGMNSKLDIAIRLSLHAPRNRDLSPRGSMARDHGRNRTVF